MLTGLTIGLLSAGAIFLLNAAGLLTRLEAIPTDLRFRLASDPSRADRRIVIVNISQNAIETAAKDMNMSWPWPRAVYGEFLDRIAPAKPAAVFFDLFFTEQSSYGADDDRAFAEAIRRAGNVYLPAMFRSGREASIPANDRIFGGDAGLFKPDPLRPKHSAVTMPYGILLDALRRGRWSSGAVDVTFYSDEDTVGRHYSLFAECDGLLFASPAMALNGNKDPEPGPNGSRPRLSIKGSQESVRVSGGKSVYRLMTVRFHGGPGTHRRVDFLDVMNPEIFPEARIKSEFAGKFVLIGSDAGGLLDLRPGPFPEPFAGVEYHAAALDNLLNGTFLRPMPKWALAGTLALLGVATALAVLFWPVVASLLVVTLLVTGYGAIALVAFRRYDLRLDVAGPALATGLSFAAAAAWSYAVEGRRRREAKYALEHFIPPQVVSTVLEDLEKLKLGGEKKEITIFFSDLAGFTTLSETLTPEVLVDVINEYLTAMCRILHDHGATIDKYVGDAIVAFWGAPLAQPDHALRACRAAIENQIALKQFREALKMRGLPRVEARIGLNTGSAVVGFMGFRTGASSAPKKGQPMFGGLFEGLDPGERTEALTAAGGRFNYTMMGDAVNLGSRLEGVNKEFGTRVMLSEATVESARRAARDLGAPGIEVRELGLLRVKGKLQPTRIYELLALEGQLDPARATLVARFHEGLALYRARKFAEARAAFEACLKDVPDDGPSRTYVELCGEMEKSPPPPDWDSVHVMTHK